MLFHNVDILSNIDLNRFYIDHIAAGGIASLVVKDRPTSRHLIFNGEGLLAGWRYAEKRIRIITRKKGRGYYETAFSGIYVLNPDVYEFLPEEKIFSLTPWILHLSKNHRIEGWDQEDDYWFDLGTAAKLKKAEKLVSPDPDEPFSFLPN